jgi:LmbE family N-acetylglucosaminyl deacetylase
VTESPADDPLRVLVVVAHPDDLDFGAGGTLALWTAAGIEVSCCLVTDGDAGGFDPDVPRDRIAGIRQAEQRAAAKELGVDDLTFLGYPDGRLTVTVELRRDLSRVIRQKRPHRVLTQSPERTWERVYASHPDHLAAGEATLCAVYPDARNPFAHPELVAEGHQAWTVEEVWVMGGAGGVTDRHVDITDVVDRKLAALRAHESQTAHMTDLEDRVRWWGEASARTGSLPEGRLAESFRVLDTR